MAIILPALGVLFILVTAIIIIVLFFNQVPHSSAMLYEEFFHHNGLTRRPLSTSQHQVDAKEDNLNSQPKDENASLSTKYLANSISRELERKNKLRTVSLLFTTAMVFCLVLIIIGGLSLLWESRTTWHILSAQKLAFLFFYTLALVLSAIGIFLGLRSTSFESQSNYGLLPSLTRVHQHPEAAEDNNLMIEQYKVLAAHNLEKERNLQNAKYVFLFTVFSISIVAVMFIMSHDFYSYYPY